MTRRGTRAERVAKRRTRAEGPAPRRTLLVYGAYGFTGRLVLEHLARRGIRCILGGRDARRLERLSAEMRAPFRVFGLEDAAAADRGLREVDVALNAAGPFVNTAEPFLRACLRNRVHYLDVSGELGALAQAAAMGDAARREGVMLLPGVGFDVVPSDCLALHLAKRLPQATELTLSVSGSNLMSRGSARTFAEHAGIPVFVRKGGKLEPLFLRTQLRFVDFGFDVRPAIAVSWGDLVTAFHSTGIPNIEVYFEATAARSWAIGYNQWFGWTLGSSGARAWLRGWLDSLPDGPAPEQRAADGAVIVAEARTRGRKVRARLRTPEAYTFTGAAGAAVIEAVLGGAAAAGFQTPASLLGADFVLSLPGVLREDLE